MLTRLAPARTVHVAAVPSVDGIDRLAIHDFPCWMSFAGREDSNTESKGLCKYHIGVESESGTRELWMG